MKRGFVGLLFACLPLLSLAESGGEEGAAQVTYINLFPALVGNYGSTPKLRYYKADVALRVGSAEAAKKVEHHEPLIRNQLVALFAQQDEQTLGDLQGKEQLRQQALKEVRQALTAEEGQPLVDDLLFNNLVVQ